MDPILVPGPSKEAFNKNRRVSDLIRAQVAHLKHLEQGFAPEQREQVAQHAIITEDDAARYIASMTRILHGSSAVRPQQAPAAPRLVPPRKSSGPKPLTSLSIAAAADESETGGLKRSRSKAVRALPKDRK